MRHSDMPKNCWILLAFALLWLRAACGFSAEANPQFIVDVWERDNSLLPQNAVISLIQTQDGFLWVGTLNGLARFDGLRFKCFDEGNTPGLNSSRVIKLFEDSKKNLWIGTDSGGIFCASGGRVRSLALGRGTRESRLSAMCEDPSGAVWLYTTDGFLGRCDPASDRPPEAWQVTNPPVSKCRSMIIDDSGVLWLGTDFTLFSLRPAAAANPKNLPPAAYNKLSVGPLDLLLASRSGGFWVLGAGHIQKWKGNRQEVDLGPYPWDPKKTRVNAACEDADGRLVVGTGGEGIFWFDSDGHDYVQLASPTNGLTHNTILSLCLDREGDLWVGTDGRGLNRVKRSPFQVLDGSRGLAVQSVCEDQSGGLWIGYWGERIDHLKGGKLEQFGRLQGLVNLGVKSVLVDPGQNVWAGTDSGGLLRLREGSFERAPGSEQLRSSQEISVVFKDPENRLWTGVQAGPQTVISALFQDRENRLWAGTQAGLASYDGREWQLVTNASGWAVRAIAEDREGALWIGTEGGGLLRQRDGEVVTYRKNNCALPTDNISSLYEDQEGVLWVGTSGGLARLQAGKWASFAGRLGSATGSIGYLIEDAQGHLWLGSNAGLLRVRKRDLNDLMADPHGSVLVRSYGKAEGLPTGECSQGSQPAACRTRDGRLWFPTTQGLVYVDPARLVQNTNPPPVIIESVWIDEKLQGEGTLRSPVLQELTVPAGAESIEIHYTSLNLSAPEKGLFKYRLEHHETGWSRRLGTERYVRYTRVPQGHYRFQVMACNEDGVWNDAGASLAITVLPPFWQTWWFVTLTTLCLVGLIVGGVHYVSTQKLQRQLAVLRQQEALERERARIARDLHDQLGANLTQVALLGEMAEADKKQPDEVAGHARQISQTARETTRALDEIVWTVNPSNDTLDGLINYVCKYAQEYLAVAGLRYRLEVPAQLPSIPISPELRHNVFLAVKEAVNNIVKHAKATSAWLRLRLETDRFVLEIEDDGRGLPAVAEKKGRNGLRNMRKRMEDIGGEFLIGPGGGKGTRVCLAAPLRNGGTR
jgi:ligand-binding sensor domain-containing protein/signal transduction histidine kinase